MERYLSTVDAGRLPITGNKEPNCLADGTSETLEPIFEHTYLSKSTMSNHTCTRFHYRQEVPPLTICTPIEARLLIGGGQVGRSSCQDGGALALMGCGLREACFRWF